MLANQDPWSRFNAERYNEELKHEIDWTERSIAWYEKHFPKAGAEGVTNVQP